MARTYVWLMAKSLNCNQTITDGSTYPLKEVFFLKDPTRKPSMSSLSDLEKLAKHCSIKKKPLGEKDWVDIFQKYDGDFEKLKLDDLASDHINNFWKPYGITFHYTI